MTREEALKDFGLNDNEVKAYLALIELGTAKVQRIAEKAGILRTTAYEVLKSLVEKGLVSYAIRSGVRCFEAADPVKLKSILMEKMQKINEIIPELNAIKKTVKEKPKVELYEGKEGLKTVLDDIINTAKELHAYANYGIFELLEFDFPRFVKRRVEKKIFAHIIQERVEPLQRMAEVDKQEFREIRFLPMAFKSNVFIYGNKVAILTVSEKEPIGVLIENEDIAKTQRQVFDLLWEISKK